MTPSAAERQQYENHANTFAPMVAAVLAGRDRERTHAEHMNLILCVDLGTGEASKYRPLQMPPMPRELDQLGLPTDNHPHAEEALEKRMPGIPLSTLQLFSRHRTSVTELEARNAQRLLLLCSTANRTELEHVVLTVGSFLAENWPPACAMFVKGTKLRDWAVLRTRDYNALPVIWRHVDLPMVKASKSEAQDD